MRSNFGILILLMTLCASQANARGISRRTPDSSDGASQPKRGSQHLVIPTKTAFIAAIQGIPSPFFTTPGLFDFALSFSDLPQIEAIENLLEVGEFIPFAVNSTWFASKEAISHIGLTQKAFVHVLHFNPSFFKDKKFCPDTHQVVNFTETVDGQSVIHRIQMCPDLPVDSVIAVNQGNKDSDEEFIVALNKIYETAGLPTRYRRASTAEFIWFDTKGDTIHLTKDHPELWKYATYYDISDQDPTKDPREIKLSPSMGHQTYSVKAKLPTASYRYALSDGSTRKLEFRRTGGVWEWTGTMASPARGIVGGSWNGDAKNAASGFRSMEVPHAKYNHFGASRLVRTE